MMTGGGGYAPSWKNRKGISICCQSETGCWQKWFARTPGLFALTYRLYEKLFRREEEH